MQIKSLLYKYKKNLNKYNKRLLDIQIVYYMVIKLKSSFSFE